MNEKYNVENSYLTIDEASQYLSMSKTTLRRRVAEGILPARKGQGSSKTYFRLKDLDDFMVPIEVPKQFSESTQKSGF